MKSFTWMTIAISWRLSGNTRWGGWWTHIHHCHQINCLMSRQLPSYKMWVVWCVCMTVSNITLWWVLSVSLWGLPAPWHGNVATVVSLGLCMTELQPSAALSLSSTRLTDWLGTVISPRHSLSLLSYQHFVTEQTRSPHHYFHYQFLTSLSHTLHKTQFFVTKTFPR